MSQIKLLNDLVSAGLITASDKEEIIKKQWDSGESIERILIDNGYISEDRLLNFISRKYRLPMVSLHNLSVDEEATYHIPAYLAKKLNLIPVRRIDKNLIVAIAEPFNETILSELRKVTDLKFVPLLAKKSEIDEKIQEFYDHRGEEIKEVSTPPAELLEKKELPGSFEKFIVGPNNEKAYKLALAFVKSEIESLLIVGDTGTGKTYLLGAIDEALKKSGKKSLAMSVPEFESSYQKFKDNSQLPHLREFILSHDVFIIDEIELLQNKPYLQEEVEFILERFQQDGKQTAAATMVPVSELRAVSRKLVSLLGSMIEVELGELDRDTAMRYLNSGGFGLTQLDIETILKENPRTFRELEGIVKKVLAIKKFLSSSY